ncbi:hypothetical protein K469DRAFT_700636 [Zopfia rhizophila CBS 207.26]|uniref:Nudix hydrolase domain-containing protein n=1 Tax=Zopfia rhizophila CBS 207.26 TaxID=1314779 RepID=A0A6A6EHV1_9PEZI|nr:hypothetical protein K469DRAFT_700636 [Zopfia rhizophila CBS 207.26]
MAASTFITSQFSSEQFVESCGAILFDLTCPEEQKVCLIHYLEKDEWLLAKGRRNCGESRKDAALREVMEETGYCCQLHPVTMSTRAPQVNEPAHIPDKARSYPNLTEPFMLTVREIDERSNVKLIWWYIVVLDEDASANKQSGEADFRSEFIPCKDAVKKLTFQADRDVLEKAIQLIKDSTSCSI